jgi:hypothetical protein
MYLVQFWSQTKLDGLLQSLDVQEHPKVMDLWTKTHTGLGEEFDKKPPHVKVVDFSWIVIYLSLGMIVMFWRDVKIIGKRKKISGEEQLFSH